MYPQVTATKWSSVIGNTFHSGRKKKSLNNGRIVSRWSRTLNIYILMNFGNGTKRKRKSIYIYVVRICLMIGFMAHSYVFMY